MAGLRVSERPRVFSWGHTASQSLLKHPDPPRRSVSSDSQSQGSDRSVPGLRLGQETTRLPLPFPQPPHVDCEESLIHGLSILGRKQRLSLKGAPNYLPPIQRGWGRDTRITSMEAGSLSINLGQIPPRGSSVSSSVKWRELSLPHRVKSRRGNQPRLIDSKELWRVTGNQEPRGWGQCTQWLEVPSPWLWKGLE